MTIPNTWNPFASVAVANVTTISTSGTTTVAPGPGAYFGYHTITSGTNPTVFALDGTNTLDGTSTITAVSQNFTPMIGGVAARFNTSLIIVQAGATPATINVFWD